MLQTPSLTTYDVTLDEASWAKYIVIHTNNFNFEYPEINSLMYTADGATWKDFFPLTLSISGIAVSLPYMLKNRSTTYPFKLEGDYFKGVTLRIYGYNLWNIEDVELLKYMDPAAAPVTNPIYSGITIASLDPTGLLYADTNKQIKSNAQKLSFDSSSGRTTINETIHGCSKTLANNTTTDLVSCALTDNSAIAGIIDYAIEVVQGTVHIQYEVGSASFGCIQSAGGFGANSINKFQQTSGVESGTLTVAFTITDTSPSVVKVNANSSLSSAVPRIRFNVRNLTSQAMTIV